MSNEHTELQLLAKRIVNRIGLPIGINPFPRAFPNPLAEFATNTTEVFDEVYRRNYWGSEQSRSGMGSEIAFTDRYRTGLEELIKSWGFRRIFDAPCGDLNWITPLVAKARIDYIGGDISALVIEDARSRHLTLDLRVFDITKDPFLEADVWHCRDCLFHLPFESIRQALANFSASKIPYALITSHRARWLHQNLDVGVGGFRFLDLERVPISLPPPLARIPDFVAGSDFPRYVCLWSREKIAEALAVWSE